jgi:hypothetical protein
MKKGSATLSLFLLISILHIFPDIAQAGQGPEVFMPEKVFSFGSAWEGDIIPHDFIIINKGSSPLEIIKIEPDCGCTAASGEQRILPLRGGKISLLLSTEGYGGETLNKITKIYTNDPAQPLVTVELKGYVKNFVDLSPDFIELKGKVQQKIISKMTITPATKEIDFKIVRSTAKDNSNIRFEIKRNDQTIPAHYELIVENVKKDPGRYTDLIVLLTDTSQTISIRVFGNISQ